MIYTCDKDTLIYKLNTRRCNCFVIYHNSNYVLIDTSMKFECKRLEKELKRNKINNINAIFLTHNHTDHVANVSWLTKKYNCNAFISSISIDDVKVGVCSLPKPTQRFSRVVYFLASKLINTYNFCKYTQCPGILPLTKEIVTGFLGEKIYYIKTEGHSKDSVSFIINNSIAIVGDSMVNKFGKIFPPFADNPEKIKGTWNKLLDTEAFVFLPAHGEEVTAKMLRARL